MNSCQFIDTTLIFSEKNVAPCLIVESAIVPLYLNPETEEIENIDFKQRKNEIKSILNNEEISNFYCKTCRNLNTNNQLNSKYNYIILSLWSNYNFEYDIVKIIKRLYEQDLIDKENLKIKIHCKDIFKLSNLEQIISSFNKRGYKEITFIVDDTTYIPTIKESLKKGNASLQINIIFKDNEEFAVKNSEIQYALRSYIAAAKDKNAISVHYKLIENFNDTEKDITKFIKTMYMIGINKIGIKLDNKNIIKWLNGPLQNIDYTKRIRNLILIFFKLVNRYSFYIDMDFRAQALVLKKIFKTHKNKKENIFINKTKKLFIKKDN